MDEFMHAIPPEATACVALGAVLITIISLPILTGWRRVANKYPLRAPYRGDWKKGLSGKMGPIFLNRCLEVATTSEYLYLSLGPLSILMGPPIQIPWSAVRSAKQQGNRILLDLRESEILIPADAISPDTKLQFPFNRSV